MKIEDVVKMVKYPALNRTAAEEAEAREVIIAALEKQIQKPLKGWKRIPGIGKCPVCGCDLVADKGDDLYCCDCGQRVYCK